MTRTVRELMTKTVVAAREGSTFRDMVGLLHEHRVSALPVVSEDGRIVGVVSEADLLLKEDPEVLTPRFVERRARRIERGKAIAVLAGDLMTSPAITLPPDATVTQAAHLMHERHVKRLFVTDAEQRVLGVVSRVDLLRAFLRDDRTIREDVERMIRDELCLPPHAVGVVVKDGVVTLEGQVERRTLVPNIEASVRGVEGVVGVDERLTWELDDTIPAGYGIGWIGY